MEKIHSMSCFSILSLGNFKLHIPLLSSDALHNWKMLIIIRIF